jgi:hypothetical protein
MADVPELNKKSEATRDKGDYNFAVPIITDW